MNDFGNIVYKAIKGRLNARAVQSGVATFQDS